MAASPGRPQSTVLVLTGILLTIMLAGIDTTIVSTVVPTALPELGGEHLYAWTFAAYLLATAISMPIWGPGSDRWGRKRTFLAGVVVFVVGSLACAVAPTMPLFIAARALQGIGAGAVSSLPFIVLGVVFPPHKRGRALGVISSAWAISSVVGPLLGTLIVANMSWRWAFLLNLPIGLVALALVARGMRESVGDREGAFDLAGAILAGVGGAALIWGFTLLQEGARTAGYAAIAVGVAGLVAFLFQERRAARPILPLAQFRHRGYASAMGASFLTFFSGFGIAAYIPVVTHEVYASGAAVGLVVGSFTIGWSFLAFGTGRIVHRVGERVVTVAGLLVHGAGLVAMALLFHQGLPIAMLTLALAGAGMGLLSPGLTVVVQNSVEVKRMGSATTSQQFVRQVGAAVGVTVFVLAATLGGFAWALATMGVATAAGLLFALRLPAHSLHAHAAPTPSEGA